MENFVKYLAVAITIICTFMIGLTWGQPGVTMVWTIALVGWLGVVFGDYS